MLEMELTPATVVIAALVLLWAVWAVRRLRGRGLCDCHDHCGGASGHAGSPGGCAVCSGCGAAERMVADLDRAVADAPAGCGQQRG